MCLKIWEIVDKAISSGRSWSEIAAATGIPEKKLLSFVEGDNCQQNIITELCEHFNLELPETCPRFAFQKGEAVK